MKKDDFAAYMGMAELPPNFTPGAPEKPGCYVLIYVDRGNFETIVRDVVNVNEKSANMLNIRPGLCVSNPDDGCLWELGEWGVVAYFELQGMSVDRLYFADAIRIGEAVIAPNGEGEE